MLKRHTPLLVLCRDSLEPFRPDRSFGAEAEAIERLGLPIVLVDHDALVRGEGPGRIVRHLPVRSEPILAAYRGWMVTPEQYRCLYETLTTGGIRLINDPNRYRHGHHLPENYRRIEGHTPRSCWLTGDLNIDRIMEALTPFGDAALMVKDFVKSRKHEWTEACYIPSAADREAVGRIVGRFLELQGDDLNEGLVFREYVEFAPVGVNPKSGMPMTEEYRIFWLDGTPIFWSAYWPEGDYLGTSLPIERFAAVAGNVESRFFAMDVARRRDGDWMIVELGDGQVSGLPRDDDAARFYEAFAGAWPASSREIDG